MFICWTNLFYHKRVLYVIYFFIESKTCKLVYKNIKPCKDCAINFICNDCPVYVYLYKKIGILDGYCRFRKCELENEIW